VTPSTHTEPILSYCQANVRCRHSGLATDYAAFMIGKVRIRGIPWYLWLEIDWAVPRWQDLVV